jgi:hypothetical protein
MRYLALVGVLLLSACMTTDQGYVRASGRTNPERLQLALAECQGEAAATPQGFYIEGPGMVGLAGSLMMRAAQDQSITSACMARHGYVVAQQSQSTQQAQVNRRD